MTRSARDICAIGAQLLRQFTAGQDAVRLPVLLASGVDYLRWQLRPRRGFGPAHPFEVIPHKLFVKRSLRSAGRSEERRVGKECRSRWAAYYSKKKRRTEDRFAIM